MPNESMQIVSEILKGQNRTLRKQKDKANRNNLQTELLYRLQTMQKTREIEAEAIMRKRGLMKPEMPTKEEFFKDENHRVSWDFL